MSICYNLTGFKGDKSGNQTVYSIELKNAMGQLVKSDSPNNAKSSIQTDDLAPGIYILKLVGKNKQKTLKLIKK